MTTGMKLIGAVILLALSVRPAPGPGPAPAPDAQSPGGSTAVPVDEARPRITSSTFETRAAERGLAAAARELSRRQDGPVWAGYAAPMVEGDRRMCCWESLKKLEDGDGCCGRCKLEGDHGWGVSLNGSSKVRLEPAGQFLVLFRAGKEGVNQIRTFSEDCELDARGRPFVWLTGVQADDSLEWLASFVENEDDKVGQASIAAIALHDSPRVDRTLQSLAAAGRPFEVREHAIFWMGQTRGRTGYEYLRKVVRDDSSTEIRKKAIFSMSQSHVPEAVDILIGLAHDDRSSEVRGEALFWLAQMAGQRAVQALSRAVDDDPEVEVKKKAVFALTQLPAEEGVPLLLNIARTHRLPEVRKEAIFWLGQSGDPRALDLIEEILKS